MVLLSSPAGIIVEYDGTPGGALVNITPFVLSINDIEVESLTEEMHPFGVAWESTLPIGVGRVAPIEISGLYDADVSPAPDALFANRVPEGPTTVTRTLRITWRSAKTTSVETYLGSYKRTADRGALTKYTVRLIPTGAVVEV